MQPYSIDCLEYLGSEHPDFELEGGARSVVQFEGILPEAAPCVAYAPINLDGQVSNGCLDVSPLLYISMGHEKIGGTSTKKSCESTTFSPRCSEGLDESRFFFKQQLTVDSMLY